MHASTEVPLYLYWLSDRFAFQWLPLHASWLSFVEAWFAILTKKRLKREERADFADAERAITAFLDTYNTHCAQPFTWKMGVRFYQRLKDKLARHRRRHRLPHWPARAATAQAVGQLRRRVERRGRRLLQGRRRVAGLVVVSVQVDAQDPAQGRPRTRPGAGTGRPRPGAQSGTRARPGPGTAGLSTACGQLVVGGVVAASLPPGPTSPRRPPATRTSRPRCRARAGRVASPRRQSRRGEARIATPVAGGEPGRGSARAEEFRRTLAAL
jgi:hypothetical protein